MSGLNLKKEPNLEDMQKGIKEAGGLFYQYRPCRRDMSTIYDIENIRHGVVYAQTPLNMNDPFDSMIGFSSEKIYENAISMIIDAIEGDDNVKAIVSLLLRGKAFGQMAELLSDVRQLQKYFLTRQNEMHQSHIAFSNFISSNLKMLYSKAPKNIKKKWGEPGFRVLVFIVLQIGSTPVASENDILNMLNIEQSMSVLEKKVEEVKDNLYVSELQKFLSTLTVSCFSASGWNNQLMWSHYANSYSGICVEYDFTQIDKFIGFIYPVTYTVERPTLTLQDLGIKGIDLNNRNKIVKGDCNITQILSYLLCKNTCWNYESEWRIINIGEANQPKFIDMPFIKSITFGPHLDKICKRLLMELCQKNGIPCYDLKISKEKYELDRALIVQNDLECNVDEEIEYINFLFQQVTRLSELMKEASALVVKGAEDKKIDVAAFQGMLEHMEDCLCNTYFIKISLNRIAEHFISTHPDEETPSNILDIVKSMEYFRTAVNDLVNKLPDTLITLKVFGVITLPDFNIANNRIKKIKELNESIEKYPWNPVYQN